MKCPTKEQILEAAKGSEEIKETLEKLFPKVFEEEKYFDLNCLNNPKTGYLFSDKASKDAGFNDKNFFQVRDEGEYKGKAFFLSNLYNWELKRDSRGIFCLIPTK